MRPALIAMALSMVACVSQSPAEARFPGREAVRPKEEVRDTFLGYFIGLVDDDSTGYADSDYLHEVLPEFTSFLSLPFEEIKRVWRRTEGGGAAVGVDFGGGLTLPIPFRVLWDTPGTITATQAIAFSERRLGAVFVGGGELTLDPMYVFDRVSGRFFIDFDPWLDVLLGSAVDDVEIRRVLLFRLDGTWYGALMGAGYDGQLVIGYFDFRENRILVPVPRRLRQIGPRFRPD